MMRSFRFKRKRHLEGLRFGMVDMETLAHRLYQVYHYDQNAEFCAPYEKSSEDVVYVFRRYAYLLCDLAATDAEAGFGEVFYRDGGAPAHGLPQE